MFDNFHIFLHRNTYDMTLMRHKEWVLYIYIKGVTVRFDFDVLESRKFKTKCQFQSNGDAPWNVVFMSLLAFDNFIVISQ